MKVEFEQSRAVYNIRSLTLIFLKFGCGKRLETQPQAAPLCERKVITMNIKFRGKVCGLEKFVYGDLLNMAQPCIVPTKGNHSPIPVEEDSIAQLVGYDTDGKEVYKGDVLLENGSRREWSAELLPQAEMDCGGVYENLYNKKCGFKLKERGENENLS